MTTLDWANRYYALGLSIVRLKPNSKAAFRSPKRFAKQRPKKREIERWFEAGEFGIGLMLGKVSSPARSQYSLVCRDFDDVKDYENWACQHTLLARSIPTYRTSRGFHVLALADCRELQKRMPNRKKIIGATGELIIGGNAPTPLPPSTHPSGFEYQWTIEPFHNSIPVVDLSVFGPEFLYQECSSGRCKRTGMFNIPIQPIQNQKEGDTEPLFCSKGQPNVSACESVLAWTIPEGHGMREKCIWALARRLKTLKETAHLPIDELKPIIRWWWKRAKPYVNDKEWFVTWAAFSRSWQRAKPESEGTTLRSIVMQARKDGCPEECAAEFGSEKAALIAAICKRLSMESMGEPFPASTSAIGKEIGVTHVTVSRCLNALVASRHIRRVKPYAKGKAAEYLWLHSQHNHSEEDLQSRSSIDSQGAVTNYDVTDLQSGGGGRPPLKN